MLATEDIDAISTSSIIRLSRASRSSFYRSFENKYDCLFHAIQIGTRESGFFDPSISFSKLDVSRFSSELICNKARFRHAFSSRERPSPYAQFVASHSAKIKRFIVSQSLEHDDKLLDIQCIIHAYEMLEFFRAWANSENDMTSEEMTACLGEKFFSFIGAIKAKSDTRGRNKNTSDRINFPLLPNANHQKSIKDGIWAACENLLLTKNIDEIKTGEIISKSAVGKSTFYRNFPNKHSVIIYGFRQLYDSCFPSSNDALSASSIQLWLTALEAKRAIALHAFSSSSEDNLKAFTVAYLEEKLGNAENEPDRNDPQKKGIPQTRIAGIVDFLIEWLRSPSPSVETAAKAISPLMEKSSSEHFYPCERRSPRQQQNRTVWAMG